MIYSKKRVLNKAIPDNNPNGLNDSIKVLRDLTVKFVSVDVSIKHPFAGDISMELIGPNGESIRIHEPTRRPDRNLKKSYSGGALSKFEGLKSKGEWKLKIVDSAERDSGILLDWTLNLKLAKSKKTEIFIRDESKLGSSQYCHQGGSIKSMKAKVHVQYGHAGDLVIDLVSPTGTSVNLYNKAGGGQKEVKKIYSGDDLAPFMGEKAEGKWTMKISDDTPRDTGKLLSWSLDFVTGKIKAKAEDLTKIEGIGPKIAGLLNDAGILNYAQLADSKPEAIKSILEKAGPRYQMHDPGSWPRQSRLAADGKWNELEKLQDELDGGK